MRISDFLNNISRLSRNIKDLHLIYRNPCLDLQRHLEIPLFNENSDFQLYSPSSETLLAAENLFIPKSGHRIASILKTISIDKLPTHDLPEVAFMGRSNAGKSSLIKAILRNVPDVFIKTSKKPGHTKSFQFFGIGQKLCLVDMPGYGVNQPEWFESVIINYLRNRKNLIKTFVVTDGDNGIKELDEIAIELLEQYKIPYCIVMTKIDKAVDGRRLRNLLFFQNLKKEYNLACCYPQPLMLSSVTYEGLVYFLAFLGHITGSLDLIE